MSFNPNLKEFYKKNEDITIFGTIWAFMWRAYVLIFGICVAIGLLVEIFS